MKRIVLSLCLLTGIALAQPPGPGPRMRARGTALQAGALKTELGLTDDQVTQLRALRRKQAEEMKTVGQQMRDEGKRLRELMASSGPDPAAVGKQTLALRALREQARAKRGAFQEQARALLTPQQRDKLKEMEASRDLAPAMRQARILGLLDVPAADQPGPLRRAPRGFRGRM